MGQLYHKYKPRCTTKRYLMKRGDMFYLKVRVPKSCCGLTSKTEIVTSLRTDSPSVACNIIAAKLHLIRRLKNMSEQNSSKEQLLELFKELTTFNEVDEVGYHEPDNRELMGTDALMGMLRDSLASGGGKSGIEEFLITQPNTTDAGELRDYEWLALRLLAARRERMISGRSEEFKRLLGIAKDTLADVVGEPVQPVLPTPVPAAPSLTLKDAWEGFVATKKWQKVISQNNWNRYEFMVAKLGEDFDMKLMTKKLVNQLLMDYQQMPKRTLKAYMKLTMKELVNLEDIPEEDLIAPKTVKEFLKLLQSFLSAYLTKIEDFYSVSPTHNVEWKFEDSRYGPYSNKELKVWVNAALAEPDKNKKWGLLLGIYSGMRASEVQRVLRDGFKVSEGGIHYYRVRDGKTNAATRNVPIHSKLIEYGILKVPKLTLANGAISSFTRTIRDNLGIPLRDENDCKRGYHSFRHSFITTVRNKGGIDILVKNVVGHEVNSSGVTDRYTHKPSLEALQQTVELMEV